MARKVNILKSGEITLADLARLLRVEKRTISTWASLGYFDRKVMGQGCGHPTVYDIESVKRGIVENRLRISVDGYEALFGKPLATVA